MSDPSPPSSVPSAGGALPPVVVVTGPTAAGKTGVALRLAESFGGEIVNCDSMQVYRGMDIGTAKATAEERRRVPHHVLDVVDPDAEYHAARYASDARTAAATIAARGGVVWLTGGTGLYVRAFLEGIAGGVGRDAALRERLEAEHGRAIAEGDPTRLHRRLAKVDPESAARVHANDLRRIVRALEVHERTGEPAAAQRHEPAAPVPYRVLHLALDPGSRPLRERIDRRCAEMIRAGLLWEVRRLRDAGYGPELPSMKAIGYRHMQPVIEGSATLDQALAKLRADTWQFARRQRTWLRAVAAAVWMDPLDDASVHARVKAFLDEQ